ncbi:uncharacterized protein BXZ73DRAFT_76613 [Epithele typhae]|uniref:uncharacterized protein n=1 Tax=Epithele typhae TaxID=378194 RepID=UPI0020086F77|nr:uncharacterized protein BXZ73DRAFT_76613 [Epithele typhae]KAH9936801.1 hypothetical protein BXZ73DRAFT_76613 [Epithele typhae]
MSATAPVPSNDSAITDAEKSRWDALMPEIFALRLQQHLHQYRLVVDGTTLGTQFGSPIGPGGERVSFEAFTPEGVSVSSTIMVYVVSPVSKKDYLVAKWPTTPARRAGQELEAEAEE